MPCTCDGWDNMHICTCKTSRWCDYHSRPGFMGIKDINKRMENTFMQGYTGNLKEEKQMDKKTRFLNAGGSFGFTPTKGFICFAHPCYIHGRQNIVNPNPANTHIHIDPVHAKKVTNRTIEPEKHYKFILENKETTHWHASGDRRLMIDDKDSVVDKHLVNIMRFLIENWQDICKAYLDTVPNYGAIFSIRNFIINAQNAPTFFALVLPCWGMLVNETVNRFGAEALTALLDGF